MLRSWTFAHGLRPMTFLTVFTVKDMIAYNTGSIIVDKDLNLLDVDGQYSEFVCEGEENSLLANVLLDDQHLLYEMIEKIDLSEKEDVCFRLLNKSGEYRWVIAM